MDFKNHIPIYVQIVDQLKRDYAIGQVQPGAKLESVRDYALRLKVNPNTVQKAYQELERIGLAESRRGLGTYLTEDESVKERILNELATSYTEEYLSGMRGLGFDRHGVREKIEAVMEEEKSLWL